MKDYFTRLFKYDQYANGLMLDMIIKAGNPEKTVQLMAHLLAAQQVWFNRSKELPAFAGALWPDGAGDTLADLIVQNSREWLNYIDELQSEDFEKSISYKNSKGDSFENKLVDVLMQVINHGTHHRAQIGQQLKLAGVDLPITDYIFYLRQSNN